MLAIYSISIEVSSKYFIGLDNRVKHFPGGIDLLSDLESGAEPLGLASVECAESGNFLISAFRLRDGVDIPRLVMVSNSPGVIDFAPVKIIFPTHLKGTISSSEKSLIKSLTGVNSISFSSLDSDLAKSLPMHEFSLSSSMTTHPENAEELIASFNKDEYERSIKRSVLKRIRSETVSEITEMRLANAVTISYPKTLWRSAVGAVKPSADQMCVVTERFGLLDICAVTERMQNHGGEFGGSAYANFEDWMNEDDDTEGGYGYSVQLDFDSNMYRLFVYQMLIAHPDFDEDAYIDPEYIEYLFEEQDDLSLASYNTINEVVCGDCIFKDVDSENISWPIGIVSEDYEVLGFFELCPPNQSKHSHRYFITWSECAVHITIMENFRYSRECVIENVELMCGADFEIVRVSAKHISQIASMIDLVDNHESMTAAVKLIVRILSANYEEYFGGIVDRY
jgi:hypothetical protein